MMLNIFDISDSSEIYGPGKRMVIWLQGCAIRCEGCWNTEMWSFEPKHLYTHDEIFERFTKIVGLEGITFIGGEPLNQSKDLLHLADKIKKMNRTIVLFTGYEFEELKEMSQVDLWKQSDIIICGRYDKSRRNVYLQWRGSENQKVIFNTQKYQNYKLEDANYCEIDINEEGEIDLSGFPGEELRQIVRGDSL